jgi:peptidoglycan hydrolase-like protein with peptidoglycan-binding domain
MRKKMLGYIAAGIAFFMTMPQVAYAASSTEILSSGDTSQSVVELQQALMQKGYFESEITGYFGPETQNAVIEYQEDNGLVADGKVGPETSDLIFQDDYTAFFESLTDADGTFSSLSLGDTGDNVILLQERLLELEYYDYDTVTGYFGPVTEESVKKFQNCAGLGCSGIADADTLSALFSDSAAPYTMSPGDTGGSVQKLQIRLADLGYFSADPTGYYGSITTYAVQEFQKQNGLAVDGKAGSQTRAVLYSDDALPNEGGEETPLLENTATQSKSEIISDALSLAYSLLGKDYIYGACGPNSFDCSGFIYYILKNSGLAINPMSPSAFSSISAWETIPDIENLQIGDLVFFNSETGSYINHIGIYVGGGSFIHASQSNGSVVRSSMTNGYYNENFAFAKRID